jgi:hypothetical protein
MLPILYELARFFEQRDREHEMDFVSPFRARCTHLLVSAVLFSEATICLAQVVSGNITGTVQDTTGANIPNVSVTLTRQESGLTRSVLTDNTGSFVCPGLLPGKYRIVASRDGFKTTQVIDLDLQIDQTLRTKLVLQLGTVSEKVEVSADVVQLQTDTPAVGQVIEGGMIVDLPLNGRNFLQLAALSSSVVPATVTSAESARSGRVQVTAHIADGRGGFNSYLIDGQETREARFGMASILPAPDMIQEFKIQRSFYSAEYGMSANIISLTTKSGTNDFHGSAYEFLRNDAFDTRQYFDRTGKPPFRLNQFGFTFGGPVQKDKTFFFAGYEGKRQRLATTQFASVPSQQFLQGNFSSLLSLPNPVIIKDPFNNYAPFPGNIVTPDRFATISKNYSTYIPPPNGSFNGGTSNFVGTPSQSDDSDQFDVRVDHQFSGKDSLFGRYSQSDWDIVNPSLLALNGTGLPLDGKSAVIEVTHVFDATTLNTIKLGYNRSYLRVGNQPASTNLPAELGFRNIVILPQDYSLPNIVLSGYTGLGHPSPNFNQWTNIYALSDVLAVVRGHHNLAFGLDLRFDRNPQIFTGGTNGYIEYDGLFTGDPVADYLLGAYTYAAALQTTYVGDFRYRQLALFAQDDWKIAPRLTFNYGVRWEYHSPPREMGGSEGYFDPSIGALRVANAPSFFGAQVQFPNVVVGGVRPGIVEAEDTDFAPRVGFAFQITPRTVLRGGYGIYYATNNDNNLFFVEANPAVKLVSTSQNTPGSTPRLVDTLFDDAAVTASSGTSQLDVVNPNAKTLPYIQQWSVDVQRELPFQFQLQVGYVGSVGKHLQGTVDLNQAALNAPGQSLPIQQRRPFPQFAAIAQQFNGEFSNYNALNLQLERRFVDGFSVQGSYTWAKSLDTYSAAANEGTGEHHPEYGNIRHDYGPSAFDVGHRIVGDVIFQLPFGRGKRFLGEASGFGGWLVGGWQSNAIAQWQTGYPFSVLWLSDRSQTGSTLQRPDVEGDPNLPRDQRSPLQWFKTSVFTPNPVGTFGNSGRDIIRGAGFATMDFSLLKNTRLTERFNLQFRAELFNVLNHTNFGPPGNFIDGPNFGVVTSSSAAREIQFAVKLLY